MEREAAARQARRARSIAALKSSTLHAPASLMCNGWVLKPAVGGLFFGLYFVFVVFSLADNYYHLI